MKYCKTFCIYAALLIVMCSTWIEGSFAQDDASTWMPDDNLRTFLESFAQLNPLTKAKLAVPTAFNLANKNIKSIKGLEYATAATAFGLEGNQISDISPLKGLTSLTELDIKGNQISDISPLKGLTSLNDLYLDGNQINDISSLNGLTNLKRLWLHGNQIYRTDANIAALKSLTGLTALYLDADGISDLGALNAARRTTNPDESLLRALLVTPPPPPPEEPDPAEEPAPVEEPVKTRKRIIVYRCPIGWIRDPIVGNSKKAMIYEVKVDIDLTHPISIYTLKSLAIYVHPDERLETLEGWYLTTGPLYNHNPSRKFQLTAENSVIDEQGFAYIKNPDTPAIRMGTLSFIGQRLPSFDYRLYDDRGMRVDFGISCYKESGLTDRLWNTKDPSVVRVLPLVDSEGGLKEIKDLNWGAFFYRSKWTAAIRTDSPAETAPAAPSRAVTGMVGKWADLKKQ